MNQAEISTSETESWIAICPASELSENIGVCALLNKQQVALFRLTGSDRIYALDNYDPFSKANVISRGIVGDIKGIPVVASPIYKQHFDLATGQCIEDVEVKLRVYCARINDDVIQLKTT